MRVAQPLISDGENLRSFSMIHVVPTVASAAGGLSYAAKQLAWALTAYERMVITVFSSEGVRTLACPGRKEIIDQWPLLELPDIGGRLSLTAAVRDRSPVLIHNHGLWSSISHRACATALRTGVPLIIQPHGMLEPWALSQKHWKKRIAMALYQRRNLNAAAVLVATSAEEYQNIRTLGYTQPIAVIPNGVQFDITLSDSEQPVSGCTQRKVLFLSRIHPKKGLLNLMEAWGQVRPENWRLVIAGPDEGGHWVEVLASAHANGIADIIDYVGEVDGDRKEEVYQEADLFVLPTFSENFGVVVPEALAYGVPVITTKGAPWADLEKYQCGWWINTGVEPLVNALREAISLSDDERGQMGARGRIYAQRYNWPDIARQMADVYRWVLKRGERPDCVFLD